MRKSKKAVIYARANSQKEIAYQSLQLTKFAELSEFTSSSLIYYDLGNTSRPLQRSGLKQLLQDSSTADYDYVVALSTDRIARDSTSLREVISVLKRSQKKLIVVNIGEIL